MAKDKTTELYPDLFFPDPEGAAEHRTRPTTDPLKKAIDAIDAANRNRARFFASLKHVLVSRYNFRGALGPTPPVPPQNGSDRTLLQNLSEDDKAYFVGVAGNLLARNQDDPTGGRDLGPDETYYDDATRETIFLARGFVDNVGSAVSSFNRDSQIYGRAFSVLQEEGQRTAGAKRATTTTVWARQVSMVSDRLIQLGIAASDAQFPFHARTALSQVLRGDADGNADQIDIEILDLEEGAQADILEPNVRALSPPSTARPCSRS